MSTYYSKTDDISFIPLTVEEEKSLFTKFYAGDVPSRDELIARHLKLVAKLSLFYAKGSLADDEAISAGNFGLIQALESKCFQKDRDPYVRFGSYMRCYVRGQVLSALRQKGWKGHLPEDDGFEAAPEAVTTGRHARQLAGGLTLPPRKHCRHAQEESVDHAFESLQLSSVRRELIEAALEKMPELEARTVRAVYFEGKNFADVGRERNMSREGVRKAHGRALVTLKSVLENLKPELC